MKYLKVTLAVFVATLVLSSINAGAGVLALTGVHIPALKGTYYSSSQNKSGSSTQIIAETNCTDNLSGDLRNVEARVHGQYAGMVDSAWVNAVKGQNVYFDSNSTQQGAWQLQIRATKNLPTAATFYGAWQY